MRQASSDPDLILFCQNIKQDGVKADHKKLVHESVKEWAILKVNVLERQINRNNNKIEINNIGFADPDPGFLSGWGGGGMDQIFMILPEQIHTKDKEDEEAEEEDIPEHGQGVQQQHHQDPHTYKRGHTA